MGGGGGYVADHVVIMEGGRLNRDLCRSIGLT